MSDEIILGAARRHGAQVETWMIDPPNPGLIYMTPEQLRALVREMRL